MLLSLQLKKEQEIQKQMLWHTFQEKNKQLELQHKLQLEHKYQVSEMIFDMSGENWREILSV